MAVVRPFRAIRPKEGLEDKIAALPYDVYNRAEAKEKVKGNPLSFLNIDRAETQFPDDVDTYDDRVYLKARELFDKMLADGNFITEEKPCYYIYELTMDGRSQTGIVACSSVDDYINGVIKKHENTRADKEADRIRHVDTVSAQTGPIFLAYKSNEIINNVVDKVKKTAPVYDFTADDGILHRAWIINDENDIEKIYGAFENISSIYIADGHHRCASAVKVSLKRREEEQNSPKTNTTNSSNCYNDTDSLSNCHNYTDNPSNTDKKECRNYDENTEYNYFLSVLFPDDQLMIMDYNRVIKDLNGYSPEEVLNKLEKVSHDGLHEILCKSTSADTTSSNEFDNTTDNTIDNTIGNTTDDADTLCKPTRKGQVSVFLNNTWYSFDFNDELKSDDPVKGLDVSILQDYVIDDIFGIKDPKTDKRIDFVGGIRGLKELERRCNSDCKIAFAMYPTAISELFAAADAGLLMPPKSTWFEPKLRSGLFIHKI